MSEFMPAYDRWEPYKPSAYLTGGPERVIYDDPAPEGWRPRPVGFRAVQAEVEPLLWEGDDA